MDISGEIANLRMRTDAKNLVTTARTNHLPERKETIHMISMLPKEAYSGSTHDLAHIPTENCLADCLTKDSAKADNPITAVKTGKLLYVDIHTDFRTVMELWCKNIFVRKGEGSFFLKTLKISLAPTLQEGPFQVMFVGTQQTKGFEYT